MIESVTLLGERRRFSSRQGSFPADIIVGIEGSDGVKSLMRRGDPRYPRPHEVSQRRSSIALGKVAAARLVDLYTQLFVSGQEVDYDCNGFPLYLAGETDELRRDDFKKTHGVDAPVFPNDLEPGRPYAIQDVTGKTVHAMIAMDQINSLGLMGRSVDGGGLMMRVANPHLMDLYQGVSIGEISRNDGQRLNLDV